jgi:hypothetical protein
LSVHEDGEQKEWYSNRDLFEKMYSLGMEIGGLRVDLAETKTQIRDYNGLREDVRKYCEEVRALKAEGLGAEIQGLRSELQGLLAQEQGDKAARQGALAEKQGARANWGFIRDIVVLLVMVGSVLVAVLKR